MTRRNANSQVEPAAPEFGLPSGDLEIIAEGSICGTPGVSVAAIDSGIKAGSELDLALIDMGRTSAAAGVFTANRAKAGPVLVSQAHLTRGRSRGVVVNSGCANACTGDRGIADAMAMAEASAQLFGCPPDEVLVASTGLIGYYLPIERIVEAIAAAELRTGDEAGHEAARSIMTTDTVPKEIAVVTEIGGKRVTMAAMAKGAAMLAPSMATMLAFLTTDVAVSSPVLRSCLAWAVENTFNRMSVDACQSTNDSVFALASGGAGNREITEADGAEIERLKGALAEVCGQLALAMVFDGEGSTRVARISVTGAASDDDALLAVRAVCSSVLVRCSLHGADPYWGRIVSELGASGASAIAPDLISISYGGVRVAQDGVALDHDELAVRKHAGGELVDIECGLGLGNGRATMFTCDLGPGYIEENQGTS